jgi:hypothetical protein
METNKGFATIIRELIKQRRILEGLGEQNQELLRSIADLDEGHHIYVEIHGKRYCLVEEPSGEMPTVTPTLQSAPMAPQSATGPLEEALPSNPEVAPIPVEPQEVPKIPPAPVAAEQEAATESSLPAVSEQEGATAPSRAETVVRPELAEISAPIATLAEGNNAPSKPATALLEEMIVEIFASRDTEPIPAISQVEVTPLSDQEKAVLRQDLAGSFLL